MLNQAAKLQRIDDLGDYKRVGTQNYSQQAIAETQAKCNIKHY